MNDERDDMDGLLTDALDGKSSQDIDNALQMPELREALEMARAGKALLAEVDSESPPAQFVARVTQRVRRRSGGRYFNPMDRPFGMLVSIDAFIVLAIAVIAACWFLVETPQQPSPPRILQPLEIPGPDRPSAPLDSPATAPDSPNPETQSPGPP